MEHATRGIGCSSRRHCFLPRQVPSSKRHWLRQRRPALVAATATEQQATEAEVLAASTRRIRDLGRQNKPREAIAELAALAERGINPDVVAATALVKACSSKPDLAAGIFNELFLEGQLMPDEVACTVLLRALGDASPPRWTAIAQLLNRMEKEFGLVIGTVTFNSLLAICARTNDETRAAELIDRMVVLGVQPDEYTLEAVRTKRSMRSLLKRAFA